MDWIERGAADGQTAADVTLAVCAALALPIRSPLAYPSAFAASLSMVAAALSHRSPLP